MKFTYPDGTVVESDIFPVNLTGKVDYTNGDTEYFLEGKYHRDGGLPVYEGARAAYAFYCVNGIGTGRFVP